MKQQGDLFRKQQKSAEGEWCVAIRDSKRWWSISRDHRFMTQEQAAAWAKEQQPRWIGELRVVPVEELGNADTTRT